MPRVSPAQTLTSPATHLPVLQWLPLAPEKRYSLGCETIRRLRMAKPNYAFAKRQRDLAKKQKKEEKRLKKAEANPTTPPQEPPAPASDDQKTVP
jgi:hypothetical protein